MIAFLVLVSFLRVLHCTQSAVYNPSGGPVYVNPDSPQAVAVAVQQNEAVEMVTQTVYGFLDFTTTIGNTVMVFSPQSAGAPDAGKKILPATSSVIQTKPAPQTVQVSPAVQEIKPSKTVGKPSEQKKGTNGKVTSSVEVKAAAPSTVIHSVVEVRGGDGSQEVKQKIAPSSSVKVEVRSGPSSVVEVLSSKVEVREGSTAKNDQPQPSIKVQVLEGASSVVEVRTGPSKVLSSHVEVVSDPVVPTAWSSVVEVRSSSDEPALSGNNIVEPEYDFLSRQPSEVVDETYRVINLRPSSKFHLKPRIGQSKVNIQSSPSRGEGRPTGLVTKLGGTVVKEGVTTVHETSVIGTYISGKYAQVLQSTSHIFHHNNPKPKPTPTSSLRILKTAAPVLGAKSRPSAHLDPTPSGTLYEETLALPLEALFSSAPSSNLIRPSRRPGIASSPKNSLHNRFHRNRGRGELQDNREQELGEGFDDEEDEDFILNSRKQASSRPAVRPTQSSRPSYRTASKNGFGSNRFGRVTSTPELATVSVFSETATPSGSRRYHSSQRRNGFRPSSSSSSTTESTGGYSRRGYKPRVQASSPENTATTTSTSLYKFKLSRPTGRWQYKTTPRPRVTIRKSGEDEALGEANGPTTPFTPPQANARSDEAEQDTTGSETEVAAVNEEGNMERDLDQPQTTPTAETIKVEISTPADFKDTYYEIATIKSPYTFQVGTVKNTRYITVTSTIEKSLEPETLAIVPTATATEPLTENILASTAAAYEKDNNLLLESSIATLPPIGLAGDAETPPLETLTETFSTTQLLLKTHILPVIRGGSNTTRYTLIQSYHVTRLVTATKTLPPMEVYHFVPSKTLNEFNTRLEEAGSELHLELDVGDQNDQYDDDQPAALRALQPDIDLANIGSDFDVSDVDKTRIPEGHLRLKKPSVITTPRPEPQPQPQTPALSPEQIQQLAFLRLLNPAAAAAIPQVITTSRPVLKVETVYESHVLPVINGASTIYSTISRPVATVSKTEYEYGTSTLPALPVAPVNPLFPPQQQQFAITSTPVVTQTVVTETNSKVLKLTFGAKTAYTTLLSTKVVPTVLTTYVTASIPVQPTAPAFPGFFPAAYPQFPFVG